MIELLRESVVIQGKIPSMANLGMSWRVARIPTANIKNPETLKKKQRFDYAMAWRDAAVAALAAAAAYRAPAGSAIFAHVALEFKQPKGKPNPAGLAQDIDNPAKAILDAVQKAGLVANDKQVICLLLEKRAGPATQALVLSLCAGLPGEQKRWLLERAMD